MRFTTPTYLAMIAAAAGLSSVPALADGPDDRPLPTAQSLVIGLDNAVARTKRKFPNAVVFDSKVMPSADGWVYVVRTHRNGTLRTLRFDVGNGAMVSNQHELIAGARRTRVEDRCRAEASLPVTRAQAIRAAEAALPGARAVGVELDDANDTAVYKVRLLDGARRIVVLVDAHTGRVIDQSNDGVVNLSFDEVRGTLVSAYPGWTLVRLELDDDEGFDDSGSFYKATLVSGNGAQRRDVTIDANSGAIVRDRVRDARGGNLIKFQQLAGANPAVSPTQAATAAAVSLPGSRVREVSLTVEEGVLVYEVGLLNTDGSRSQILVDASTGQILTSPPDDDGDDDHGEDDHGDDDHGGGGHGDDDGPGHH